ncbi:MAG: hypothetical protein K2P84_02410 [Undibacterium sp.]|nr:hypothetical protein [Undibacterium sp.]
MSNLKKSILLFFFTAMSALSLNAMAQNAPVNIAYPLANGAVKNYFHVYFTTTCPGGQNTVKWVLDNTLVGTTTFYDVASIQFAHKLPLGWHSLTVSSSCGQQQIKFQVT